jgi:hypothetical protein
MRKRVTGWALLVVAAAAMGANGQVPAGQSAAQNAGPDEATMAAILARIGPPPKTWADSVTVKGDFRARHEEINDDSRKNAGGDTYTRRRERIRARLGAEAKVNNEVKAGVEISTGQTDPVSGNQTLGDGFGKKEMRLSLAYLDYNFTGDKRNEMHAIAGKMKNPLWTLPDDLVWDGDLNPEGAAARGKYIAGDLTLMGNAGYFTLQERADKDDSAMYAAQGAARMQFSETANMTLGVATYTWENLQGFDVLDWENRKNAYGNSTKKGSVAGGVTNLAYASEFAPVVYGAAFEVWVMGRPLTVFGQMMENGDAADFGKGHMYGVSYGRAKLPGSLELGYSFAELEKDSTVGAFTDSDRWGGGTDGSGHKLSAKYQLQKNLQAGVAYYLDERKISDPAKTTDYDRLQVDIAASF